MDTHYDNRGDRERGAVLAMVAVIIIVAIGCAAFAIDTGNAWAAKRRLQTATDAAALAAAGVYAANGNGCAATDDSTVTANDEAASVTSCTPVSPVGTTPGRVTVNAKRQVDFQFARIFGINDFEVKSSTTARYGFANSAIGLRPMGLCVDASLELTAWLNLPLGPTSDSDTIRIGYNKAHPAACGNEVPGNWGMLDFNGGSNSNDEARDWVAGGYPGEVTLSPPNIPGDTGAFSNSIDSELQSLVGKEFGLPVFDVATGNGSNAEFHLVAFVVVELVDFQTTGAEADRYLDLQFKVDTLPGGGCCGTTNVINTGAMAIDICGVDEDYDVLDCTTG